MDIKKIEALFADQDAPIWLRDALRKLMGRGDAEAVAAEVAILSELTSSQEKAAAAEVALPAEPTSSQDEAVAAEVEPPSEPASSQEE